jgi:hypothetical protein
MSFKIAKWDGEYQYKGFVIWNANDDEWIAEPKDWSDIASDHLKYYLPRFSTIAKAKKWVREVGINLREEDYLEEPK